jgi:hypothetical protein
MTSSLDWPNKAQVKAHLTLMRYAFMLEASNVGLEAR